MAGCDSGTPWTALAAPTRLEDVIGQDRVCEALRRLTRAPPPMILMVGPAGVGKSTLASLWIKTVLPAVSRETCLALNASGARSVAALEATLIPFCDRHAGGRACAVVILDEADGLTVPAQHFLAALIASAGCPTSPRFGLTFIVIANERRALEDGLVAHAPEGACFTNMELPRLSLDSVWPIIAQTPAAALVSHKADLVKIVEAAIEESPRDVRGFVKALQVRTLTKKHSSLQPSVQGHCATFTKQVCSHFRMCHQKRAEPGPCSVCTIRRVAVLVKAGSDLLATGVPADRVLHGILGPCLTGTESLPKRALTPLFRSLESLRRFGGMHLTALLAGILGVCDALHGQRAPE